MVLISVHFAFHDSACQTYRVLGGSQEGTVVKKPKWFYPIVSSFDPS